MCNLVMDDLRWYKMFIVKFQMSPFDAVDGSFISYFKEYQHLIFHKHSDMKVVPLSVVIFDNPGWGMVPQGISSCIIFKYMS